MIREGLRLDHLPAFRQWLAESCIPWREGNGEYELIQVKRMGKFHSIYSNERGHAGDELVHLSVPPALESTVTKFLGERR